MAVRIVVFLPAYNEAGTIGAVIRKVPRDLTAAGFADAAVDIVVVDDGSTDDTAALARAAGADRVLVQPRNRGLGAAVRAGLAEAVRLGADVGVMIDADNEYPPEYIPELVAPILRGEADYVLGSRFRGTIHNMRLHRRLGNYFFTWLQKALLFAAPGCGSRVPPLTDGQSGMRAFSREVMERAEIIHDYNYAQVITLNLVRQGFRLSEVPISYQVRTQGQSFIKFRAYLSAVLPAIAREMRRKPRCARRESP